MRTTEARNILDVTNDASLDDINSAYRKRVKKVHPDQNGAQDAEEQFKEVKKARDALLDNLKRNKKSREQSTSKETKQGTVPPKDQSTPQSSNEQTKSHKQNKERRKEWRENRRQTTSTKTQTNTDSSTTKSRSQQRSTWQRSQQSTKSTRYRATDQSPNYQDGFTKQTKTGPHQSKSQKNSTQQKYNSESTYNNSSAQTETQEKQQRSTNAHTDPDRRDKVRTWLNSPSKGVLVILLRWLAEIKSNFLVYVGQFTSLKLSSQSLEFSQAKWLLKHLAYGFVYSIGVMILLLIILIVVRSGLAIVVGSWLGDFITLIIILVVFLYLLAEPSVGLWLFGLLVVGTALFGNISYQVWFIVSLCALILSILNFIRYVGHGRNPWWQLR